MAALAVMVEITEPLEVGGALLTLLMAAARTAVLDPAVLAARL
jgi:hypothetical protein